MEKAYEIINDISLAEKEKEVVPASEEIKPDKVVVAEEPVAEEAKVELPTIEEPAPETAEAPTIETPVFEAPVAEIPIAPIEIPVPEMPEVSSIAPAPEEPSFNPSSFAPSYDENKFDTPSFGNYVEPESVENVFVFKNEQDIDKFASGLTGDVNKLIDEKAIMPMKQTVAINKKLLAWGKQVVDNGLNKSLFDEFEEIENMYNQINTATYDREEAPSFSSNQIDNVPSFGDQDNNTFGGMNLAA